MKNEEILFLSYEEVLEKIEKQESHLLLGNGFNRGLGVNTSYSAIFEKMMENNHGIYKEAIETVKEANYDLEVLIKKLSDDINNGNTFLKKFIENKIKYDFMKTAHKIVKSGIKNVYAEKNEGIYILLQNFTNYFTLNYDSFLYLLLLNFKLEESDDGKAIAFQSSIKFIEENMNLVQNNIYKEIKEARTNGAVNIEIGGEFGANQLMGNLTKKNFISGIEIYSKTKNKNWKTSDIDKVVKTLIEEEKKNKVLEKVDDGSKQLTLFDKTKEFAFDINQETQNLFFLHGAFHIYKDGKKEKKITQTSDKALYEKLDEILNNEEKDIVCIFQAENKLDEINKSEYLSNSYSKLSKLSGCMVIIGCSLSENDDHIFEQINHSEVETIYISSLKKSKETDYNRAKTLFNNKNIILFDRETISYNN